MQRVIECEIRYCTMIMNDEWGGTWEEAGIAHFKKTTLKFTCRQ
jgi:hypothetical protein